VPASRSHLAAAGRVAVVSATIGRRYNMAVNRPPREPHVEKAAWTSSPYGVAGGHGLEGRAKTLLNGMPGRRESSEGNRRESRMRRPIRLRLSFQESSQLKERP